VKAKFLSGSGVNLSGSKATGDSTGGCPKEAEEETDPMGFWNHDEGLEEIQRISKEA